MLSFQKDRYPCLSFNPINRISSISVNLGCLVLSAVSLRSRGSNAIRWPLDESKVASGRGLRSPGLLTRPFSLSSVGLEGVPLELEPEPPAATPPPLRRVRPEDEAMRPVYRVESVRAGLRLEWDGSEIKGEADKGRVIVGEEEKR
jgi:hypothetical protein